MSPYFQTTLIETKQVSIDAGKSSVKRMSAGWKDVGKSTTRVYKIDLNTIPNDVKGLDSESPY